MLLTQVLRKLAGTAKGTAAWVTSVSNERNEIVISVVTDAENLALVEMGRGLVQRYRDANISPPKVIYTDRDCCGDSILRKIFPGKREKLKLFCNLH